MRGRVLIGWCVCVLALTASAVDWPKYNAREREACGHAIRPGEPGVRPFWNGKAVLYKHAPAFDVKDVDGAASYAFRLQPATGGEAQCWQADHPWRPIPPHVWVAAPVGNLELDIRAQDAGGPELKEVARLKFYRDAPFSGPYPEARISHAQAAERVFAYVAHAPFVTQWLKTGEPSKDYDLYCYPAKIIGAMIRALARYGRGQAEDAAQAKAIACKMADWLIAHSQAANAPLAHFPPTYWGDMRGEAVRYAGQNMLIYPACAGIAYLELAEVTGAEKYRVAAVAIARTYLKLQGADGTWPLKLHEKDGTPCVPNRLIPGRSELDFLERVTKETGDKAFQDAADRAFRYVLDGPCKTWNWQAQFEDILPKPPYANLQHGVAGETAVRLFGRGDIALGREIVDWCEDQFVVWDAATPVAHGKALAPTTLEQYEYYTPIDASMAGAIRTLSAAWRATGDELYYLKAKALADNLVRQQKPNGEIPTYFSTGRSGTNWLNCMIFGAIVLDDFARSVEGRQR